MRFLWAAVVKLLIQTHHFLESIPPAFNIATVTAAFRSRVITFIREVCKTLFKDVMPVAKVFLRQAFKVSWPLILLIVCKLASLEKEIENFSSRVDSIATVYFLDRKWV